MSSHLSIPLEWYTNFEPLIIIDPKFKVYMYQVAKIKTQILEQISIKTLNKTFLSSHHYYKSFHFIVGIIEALLWTLFLLFSLQAIFLKRGRDKNLGVIVMNPSPSPQ